MSFNVVGSDDAIEALARDVEERRSKDPSYPLTFVAGEHDGPSLEGDWDTFTEAHHRDLIALSKRHPEAMIVTGEVELDSDTGKLVSADLVRYAKGRRRIVASVQAGSPERREQVAKMTKLSLRYHGTEYGSRVEQTNADVAPHQSLPEPEASHLD